VEKKKSVLVVDDEPCIVKFLHIKLRLNGYEFITTINGAEAVELVRIQRPDIMLLEILMPDVTGMDVLQQVRTFSQIPIIVFTARPEIAQLASELGADDYIAKPFDLDLLIRKIKLILDSAQTGKE